MSRRLTLSLPCPAVPLPLPALPGRTAKVYRDSEWSEWQVEYFTTDSAGKVAHHEGATSHHDDKGDAVDTAAHWLTH